MSTKPTAIRKSITPEESIRSNKSKSNFRERIATPRRFDINEPNPNIKPNYKFEQFTTSTQIILLFVFLGGSYYNTSTSKATNDLDKYPYLWYDIYIDLHTFILIGFGFSMTYLRKYAFGAVAFTFFLSANINAIWIMDIRYCRLFNHRKRRL